MKTTFDGSDNLKFYANQNDASVVRETKQKRPELFFYGVVLFDILGWLLGCILGTLRHFGVF